MDAGLFKLIHDYLAAVRTAVDLMVQSGIAAPASNREWVNNPLPEAGLLDGGIWYRKHGYGCQVLLAHRPVDFDFGERGQVDGFDPWRLKKFVANRWTEYGFASEGEFTAAFKEAVRTQTVIYSGYTLYYLRRALVSING